MAAAAIPLLLLLILLGLLSGGGVVAAAGPCDDQSANFPLRGVANQLAAAAAGATCSTRASRVSTGPCDAPGFATQLIKFCELGIDNPGVVCCSVVVLTVDAEDDCLCRVTSTFEFMMSDLSVETLWGWYLPCRGKRRSVPQDRDQCQSTAAPPPSPPPPPPPSTPQAPPSAVPVIVVVVLAIAAVAGTVFVGLKLWLRRPVKVTVAPSAQHQLPQSRFRFTWGADITPSVTGLPPQMATGPEEATGTSAADDEEEEVVEANPPAQLPEERSQVARPRLPPTPAFDPLPPSVVPPLAGVPMMPQQSSSGPTSVLKLKDESFITESPEEALVSNLPDGGEKIRRQISELDEKLASAEKGQKEEATEVISLDDLVISLDNLIAGAEKGQKEATEVDLIPNMANIRVPVY